MERDDILNDCDRRTFLKATGAAGAAAAFSGVTAATPGRTPQERTNEFVVLKSGGIKMQDAQSSIQAEIQSEPAEITHSNEKLNYLTVGLDEELTDLARLAIKRRLEQKSFVKTVEQNVTFHTLSTPNDPKFSDQYAPQLVNAPAAWEKEDGSDATIAVVDQGVKYDHPDLQDQFGSDNGKDFVDSDQDPSPDSSQQEFHGTHVAGIAAAARNNDTGVAGMSDAQILSARALSEKGSGSLTDIADAVQWAADQGADIINMSLGGGGRTDTMKNAVQYAVDNGALPICASGNNGQRGVSYPAKYDECVAVGAVDSNENLTSFSQYGPNQDVVAPGQDVLSTSTRKGGYERLPGTSMACPAASGVAALGLSAAEKDLSPTELRSKLKTTASDIGLSDDKQGSGLVNAKEIVGTIPPGNKEPVIDVAKVDDAKVKPGTKVTFTGKASDPDGKVVSRTWKFGDGSKPKSGQKATHTYSEAGTYKAKFIAKDDKGAKTKQTVQVKVGKEPTPPKCGNSTETSSGEGYLYGWYDSSSFAYTMELDDPCQVAISLSASGYTDFDLYVTTDGRTPTPTDFDKRSIGPDSNEMVMLEDVSADQEIGILVDAYSGSGRFTISVEETGR